MKRLRSVWLVSILGLLSALAIACGAAPAPAPPTAPQAQAQITTPTALPPGFTQVITTQLTAATGTAGALTVGFEVPCQVDPSGGQCRFVDKDPDGTPVDILIQVPAQLKQQALMLTATKPNPEPPNPTKKLYHDFMGLKVAGKDNQPYDLFDPPFIMTITYPKDDGNKSKDIEALWLLPGATDWQLLPTVRSDPGNNSVTTLIVGAINGDDFGDGGH